MVRKRIFDILFSLAALIILLPFMFIIAVCIKLSSKGPILYRSQRVGLQGKPFICYKFQTMQKEAPALLQELLRKDPEIKREWVLYQKLKNDPRVTRLGAFLRKSSLDELPQFWNVLRGDLSVVGPRPLTAEEIEAHRGIETEKMLSILPGITGVSQTSGRSNLTLKERIDLEANHIDNYSISHSCRLICKTILHVLRGKGAW